MALVVINPVCGDKSAPVFFDKHVLPLLTAAPYTAVHTTSEAHARSLVPQFVTDQPLTVILGAGDGTLHEIITALYAAGVESPVNFVLVPCGTANALYASLFPPSSDHDPAYKLKSLYAFLHNKSPVHLSLATTTISSPSGPPKVAIASVVVSTALHASILHDSDALRDRHPGIERFKIAAHQNSTKWYKSNLKLTPSSSGPVQIYDPTSKSFVPSPEVEISGPFAYFLSTVNVDRLEPAFRITPLARAIPPSAPACDVLILRPLRDPTTSDDTPESRASFVAKTWKVLTGAYQDGLHVDLVYTDNGEMATGVDGPPVVEYFRCGGWEWIPDNDDPDAHFVCSDGAIHTIPSQGRATCSVDTFRHAFAVYG